MRPSTTATSRSAAFAVGCALCFATGLEAQVRALAANLGVESSGLVAPAAVLVVPASGGATWALSVVGPTVSVERSFVSRPGRALIVRLDVTPLFANMSRFVYTGGTRDSSLEFRNRTLRVSVGPSFGGGSRWSVRGTVTGLYERVDGIADSAVIAFWNSPYAGIDLTVQFAAVTSDDPFRARWNGIKARVRGEMYTGTETWWRATADLGVGRKIGPVFLRGHVTGMLGDNLNRVNRHLVGGSWDVSAIPRVFGFHYAEFRVDRAIVASGGIDWRIGRMLEVGWRGSALEAKGARAYGQVLRGVIAWQGIDISVGAAFPRSFPVPRDLEDAMIFAGLALGAL